MTSIKVHFRPSKVVGRQGSLFVRVIHKRAIKHIRLPYGIYPHQWNDPERRIRLPEDDPQDRSRLAEIMRGLNYDLARLERIVSSLAERGEFSAEEICRLFATPDNGNTVTGYVARLQEELTLNGQVRTARAYASAARSLVAFNNGKDLDLSEICVSLIRSYEQYLLERGLKMNTVSFYLRNLRAVYYKAVAANLIPRREKNPFEKVFTGVFETKRRSLDSGEMNRLARLERSLAEPGSPLREGSNTGSARALRESLMYYMFQYHGRGMSFIDMAYLKKSDIRGKNLVYRRKKTGACMEVRITAPMKKIIRYFSRATKGTQFVFPLLASAHENERLAYETALNTQNRRLKIIASMAGIAKNLSTHVARHTWATIAKRLGYSISLISEGLGHKDQRITAIYLASFERSAMDELSGKLSSIVKAA